jgi:predicted HTH transcriptional regulator
MNNTTTPDYLNTQNKDNHFTTELKTIFEYLKENVCTASMLSDATGIKQKNICRYKRDLEKQGLLKELFKNYCKTTGFKAWYITTNTDRFPMSNQIKLF